MLPIGEETFGPRRTPVVTVALIALMAGIALAVNGPGKEDQLRAATDAFGLVPRRLLADPIGGWPMLLGSAFLHANWLHLATNMLFLWVFGRGLEHELGWWYLPLYLFCAVAAGLTSALFRPGSEVPGIGASGAISGVLGAYLILLPNAEIRALILIPWGFIMAVLRGERPVWGIPAWAAILVWFALQIVESIAPGAMRSGIDHGAHIGGFLAGYLAIRVWRAISGAWPDEPEYQRVLDRPAGYGVARPNSFVRATRVIHPGVPITEADIEWVQRRGYVDPDVVPGYDGRTLIGRRLRETRYRYEPIRRGDLLPIEADQEATRA